MSRSELIPYATLLLRIALGTLFLAHGLNKLFVLKPAGVVAFFQSLGLPAFLAYLTIAAEFGGGLLLLGGIATSMVSIALVPLMIGTIVMDHGHRGWMFANPGGGWEFPAFWSVTLVVQALLGSGPYSLGSALGIPVP